MIGGLLCPGRNRVPSRREINGLGILVGDGDSNTAHRHIGQAAFLVAAMMAAPAWSQDFAAGPLEAPQSLVTAAHSTVAPVSPTTEQFNGTVAQVEIVHISYASIAAALSVNDVFGVAEGRAEAMVAVSETLASAEDPARILDDASGLLSIANNLAGPSVWVLMAPPGELMPGDDAGGPIALNAVSD